MLSILSKRDIISGHFLNKKLRAMLLINPNNRDIKTHSTDIAELNIQIFISILFWKKIIKQGAILRPLLYWIVLFFVNHRAM